MAKKKVVLLGDSIRMIGYGPRVARMLGADYEVWQPEENCRFAQYTLRGLFDWAGEMAGAEVIHWNNGLWDICDLFGDGAFTEEETYARTMTRIADILRARAPRVIFATTTPVRQENPYNSNRVIQRYNERIVPKLRELGVEINDLNALLSPDIQRYIRADDLIHLTEEGIELCAGAVARSIRGEA